MGWATWCWLGTASVSVPLVIWTDAVWGSACGQEWGAARNRWWHRQSLQGWRRRRAVCFGWGGRWGLGSFRIFEEGCWRDGERGKTSPLRAVGQPVCMTPLICSLSTCLLTPHPPQPKDPTPSPSLCEWDVSVSCDVVRSSKMRKRSKHAYCNCTSELLHDSRTKMN